jgi:hypothetical protein
MGASILREAGVVDQLIQMVWCCAALFVDLVVVDERRFG